MKHMIDILQEVSPIAHFTCWPHRDACGEELSAPPIMWWRFQDPSDELAKFLRQAVSTFPGAIPWEFSTTGRRWILMPARINEFAASNGCDGGLIAAAKLKVAEPEFCKRANAEFSLLAEHFRREWLKNQTGHLPVAGIEAIERPAQPSATSFSAKSFKGHGSS